MVIFDLDDTLYPEIDYKLSGINAVEEYISKIYNTKYKGKILKVYDEGIKDIWKWVCEDLEASYDLKESLKWIYRLHIPSIKLNKDILELLIFLKKNSIQSGILTDGRSITQRIKINKLGLNNLPKFISEEYKSQKPDLKRFKIIEDLWPSKNYVYIGDNPSKDFICSKKLNWFSIGASWFPNRLYQSEKSNEYQPNIWVNNPIEVISVIEKNFLS